MSEFNVLRNIASQRNPEKVMPVLFVGHGSPMNGIENNDFSNKWEEVAKELPKPSAIIVVSAHWLTRGTRITAMDRPRTIHDFGGFPQELFDVQYDVPGNPSLAKETAGIITSTQIVPDHDWGLDHGAWTVLRRMYPDATIPVLQLSIDVNRSPAGHYALGRELYELRKKGVLVMASGNMLHNLRMVAWDKMQEPGFGYDWAIAMNDRFKEAIVTGDDKKLIDYEAMGAEGRLAIPTPEHYLPLLYTLGAKRDDETPIFFNDMLVAGSLTMTSVIYQ